jgi:hypothetical protein
MVRSDVSDGSVAAEALPDAAVRFTVLRGQLPTGGFRPILADRVATTNDRNGSKLRQGIDGSDKREAASNGLCRARRLASAACVDGPDMSRAMLPARCIVGFMLPLHAGIFEASSLDSRSLER